MNISEIKAWLLEEQPERLEILWRYADKTRRDHVGDQVHLRGLIEFSNYCRNHCSYCGIRSDRRSIARYRMTKEEILLSAQEAAARGYGTVVLQSGDDPGLDAEWLADVVRAIKSQTHLAVTLSCGERNESELELWREAGADRYFLRFETSNRMLWQKINPSTIRNASHRLDLLPRIRALGYETGSGIMIGIPGQTWISIIDDLEWFQRLDLDMIGCGPYVPHQDTPLGRSFFRRDGLGSTPEQVPNTNLAAYKVIALTRLLCPEVNIPATTAFATLDHENGYALSLQRGANVLMVNLTPLRYRRLYEIYPAKAGVNESSQSQLQSIEELLANVGRPAGKGSGTSPHYERRSRAPVFQIGR